MEYLYHPRQTCSREIRLTLDNEDRIEKVSFLGGCDGNLHGISRLVVGRPAAEVCDMLRGITCGRKPTSCPDQLAI
ncbi:MAG: TIGR03905 family TSCPD domain-containing protein, partial [Oscillospiraceae bacterium]